MAKDVEVDLVIAQGGYANPDPMKCTLVASITIPGIRDVNLVVQKLPGCIRWNGRYFIGWFTGSRPFFKNHWVYREVGFIDVDVKEI